jgi:hypothetical protein
MGVEVNDLVASDLDIEEISLQVLFPHRDASFHRQKDHGGLIISTPAEKK